jgi:hypothetical protein
MTTNKRRGFGSQVDAMLDAAAGPAPDAAKVTAGAMLEGGAADTAAPARMPRSAPPPSSAADDDGPRLRASKRSTLAGGDVRRTVYIGGDVWRDVLRLAMRRGCTASDVTRAALADYLRRHGGGATS